MGQKIIIIGAGPAGLTAGIYSARSLIETLVIEKLYPGGNMLITEKIDNYPGFDESISGADLSERMKKQYLKWGGQLVEGQVVDVLFKECNKIVNLSDGREFSADVLIIASGSSRRKLGIEGEDKFLGKGVSYCAICDGAFFRKKKVAVIGGGDAALEEAIYLTRYATVCYLIHRRNQFRASKHFQEEILKYPTIQPVLSTVVEKIKGDDRVRSLVLKRIDRNTTQEIEIDGFFISIGQKPNVDFLRGKLQQNPSGYIITNDKMQTSEQGVFACGDVIRKSLYQVITACGEAAVAATSAEKYLFGQE